MTVQIKVEDSNEGLIVHEIELSPATYTVDYPDEHRIPTHELREKAALELAKMIVDQMKYDPIFGGGERIVHKFKINILQDAERNSLTAKIDDQERSIKKLMENGDRMTRVNSDLVEFINNETLIQFIKRKFFS